MTLSSALVGMLGVLLLGVLGLADSNPVSIVSGFTGVLFGLGPAPLFGGLAALLGPWLKRYFPFSQGILFGLLGTGTCAIAMLVADGIASALNPCPPTMGCFAPLSGAFLVAIFAGIPLAVMAGGGLVTAIYVSNSRGRARVFAAILTVTAAVFLAVHVAGINQ